MREILEKIFANVLTALYQPFGASIVFSVMFMFCYMFAEDKGLKYVVHSWVDKFRRSGSFRQKFLFAFYTSMILFKTLLNRSMWANPVANVIGVWGLYNKNGELTTEVPENLALFIPFTILFLWCFKGHIFGEILQLGKIMWQSVKITFLFSLSIEFLQLFLRLGTFQLSDLFFNTLGGFIGGLIYWCGYKIIHRSKKDKM